MIAAITWEIRLLGSLAEAPTGAGTRSSAKRPRYWAKESPHVAAAAARASPWLSGSSITIDIVVVGYTDSGAESRDSALSGFVVLEGGAEAGDGDGEGEGRRAGCGGGGELAGERRCR